MRFSRKASHLLHAIADGDVACATPADARDRLRLLTAAASATAAPPARVPPPGFGQPDAPRRPVHLAVGALVDADDAPYMLEWVAFQRAVGVGRVTLFVDDADGSDDAGAGVAIVRAALAPELAEGREAFVNVLSVRTDLLPLTVALAAAVHRTRLAFRGGGGAPALRYCGPDDADVDDVVRNTHTCLQTRPQPGSNHVGCQFAATRLAAAWSKYWRDGFLMLVDVDEFVFPARALFGCERGGCPFLASGADAPLVQGPALLQAIEAYLGPASTRARLAALGLPAHVPGDGPNAPMPAPFGLGALYASLSFYGAMFGTNGIHNSSWAAAEATEVVPRLVTTMHPRSAPYDRFGFKVPPPVTCAAAPLALVDACGAADPEKSVLRISEELPVRGILIHRHDVGPARVLTRAAGELVRYAHYSYLSAEETFAKKVTRNRNGNGSIAALVARNELGLDDWLSSFPNSGAADLAPLLLRCMSGAGAAALPECGGPLADAD